MDIKTLIIDFFMATLCLGTGIYLLLDYKGKLAQTDEQKKVSKLKIEKHGNILRLCLIILLFIGAWLMLVFLSDFIRFLKQ
jgi:hypothetical protein